MTVYALGLRKTRTIRWSLQPVKYIESEARIRTINNLFGDQILAKVVFKRLQDTNILTAYAETRY